ncbi:putative signaling protein [Abditibacteriota bacterium]|nr:putative signaling protein [Abditibacteriota bacterium]
MRRGTRDPLGQTQERCGRQVLRVRMNISDTRLVPFLTVGIVACSLVATYAWFNPLTRGGRLFALATYGACFWMLGDVIGRCSSTFGVKYLGEVVRYFGVVNVPVWMFAFTRVYCGKVIRKRTIARLFIIPVVSFAMMVTSLWHPLFFASMEMAPYGLNTPFGPYFWFVHTPYCYLLTILSVLLVLNEIGRVPHHFRSQIFFLFISLCVPFAINIANLAGWLEGYYNTALSFPIFVMLLSVGIFRHRLLDVNPIAYESVFHNVRDGVIILSRDDTILDINPVAARHTSTPRPQLIGARLNDAFSGWSEMLATCQDKSEISAEFSDTSDERARHYSIHTANFIGIDNEFDGRIITLRDITAYKQYQDSLETLAYFDPLTRLANRRRFQEEIEKTLQRAARREEFFAILYFDLNKFKVVNDTLGHEMGDELLKYVGARTASLLRAPDFVARLGGDEFVILLNNTTRTDIIPVVARLLEHIEQPFVVQTHTLVPRLSLGAAFYPQDGNNLQDLLRHADNAMYRAKAQGGGMAALP